jgi:hypothetical protein
MAGYCLDDTFVWQRPGELSDIPDNIHAGQVAGIQAHEPALFIAATADVQANTTVCFNEGVNCLIPGSRVNPGFAE